MKISNIIFVTRVLFIFYYLFTKFHLFDLTLNFFDNVYLILLFTIISILIYVYNVFRMYKEKKKILFIEDYLFIGFIAICILSNYINYKKITIIPICFSIISYCLYLKPFFINYETMKKEKELILKYLSFFISISGILNIIFALIEKLFNYKLFNYTVFFEETRLIGMFGFYMNATSVGMIYLIGTFSSLYMAISSNKKIYYVFSVFNILFIFLTGSRGSIIALLTLLFITLLYFAFKNKKVRNAVILALISSILLLGAITINRMQFISTNSDSIVTENTDNDERFMYVLNLITNYRYSMYKEAVTLGMDSPIYGNGINTFIKRSKEVYGVNSIAAKFTNEDPHNLFIAAFYYNGIIGLCIIIAFIVFVVIEGIKNIKINNNVKSYLIFGFLLSNITFSMFAFNIFYGIYVNSFIFWLLFGYILYENRNSQYKSKLN